MQKHGICATVFDHAQSFHLYGKRALATYYCWT